MTLIWKSKEFLKKVQSAVEVAAKEGAELVAEDAKNILMKNARNPTGELASQIEIKTSRYKDGGYIVQAQGPGNYTKYRATFVELGTSKMQAIPYLRPALKKNKRRINKIFRDQLK